MASPLILAAVDFSPPSERAAHLAAARAHRRGARLALVHASPAPILATIAVEPVYLPPQWVEPLRRRHDHEVSGAMRWLADRLREAEPGLAIEEHVRIDDPADGIVAAARDLGAELVVMATRGVGAVRRFLLGSVAERVVGRAPCRVLIADRGDASAPTSRFLHAIVAIDFSPLSRPLVAAAADLIEPHGRIELCHVGHHAVGGDREAELALTRRRLAHFVHEHDADHAGVVLQPLVGSPATALLERASTGGADLIAVGAWPHGGHGVGGVTDRILGHAHAATLALPASAVTAAAAPPPEHRSPSPPVAGGSP